MVIWFYPNLDLLQGFIKERVVLIDVNFLLNKLGVHILYKYLGAVLSQYLVLIASLLAVSCAFWVRSTFRLSLQDMFWLSNQLDFLLEIVSYFKKNFKLLWFYTGYYLFTFFFKFCSRSGNCYLVGHREPYLCLTWIFINQVDYLLELPSVSQIHDFEGFLIE